MGWRGTFKGAIENFDPNFRNDKISTKSWEFVRDFGRGEIFGEISPSDDDSNSAVHQRSIQMSADVTAVVGAAAIVRVVLLHRRSKRSVEIRLGDVGAAVRSAAVLIARWPTREWFAIARSRGGNFAVSLEALRSGTDPLAIADVELAVALLHAPAAAAANVNAVRLE